MDFNLNCIDLNPTEEYTLNIIDIVDENDNVVIFPEYKNENNYFKFYVNNNKIINFNIRFLSNDDQTTIVYIFNDLKIKDNMISFQTIIVSYLKYIKNIYLTDKTLKDCFVHNKIKNIKNKIKSYKKPIIDIIHKMNFYNKPISDIPI